MRVALMAIQNAFVPLTSAQANLREDTAVGNVVITLLLPARRARRAHKAFVCNTGHCAWAFYDKRNEC